MITKNDLIVPCLTDIIIAVKKAKDKHPVFADNFFHAVSLATEDLGELAKAVNDNDIEQAKREALDTIAVLVRFIEMKGDNKNGMS